MEPEIIDLSQELYPGMQVYPGMPEFKMEIHATHEEWEGISGAGSQTPGAYRLSLGEHTGTHVDGLNHMGRDYREESIDRMPLSQFYTMSFCVDLSHKQAGELISLSELKAAIDESGEVLTSGDTLLIFTDHYRRHYGSEQWYHGPGISSECARWMGEQGIAAFGVETLSPGVRGVSNKEVHRICGALKFTHYENLVNLHLLVGRGRFRFVGFPLKIRGGTGSPVRAVAIL